MTATNSAPAACARRLISGIRSSNPRKSGCAAMTPATGRPGRLGRGRGTVVVRGRHHVEVDKLGEEGLVFVDRLERPLADLRLVRRVRRVPLASEEELVDGRRAPVSIDARSEE